MIGWRRRALTTAVKVAVVLALVAAGVLIPAAEARADSPSIFGWWTSTDQSTISSEPIPTLIPGQSNGYADPMPDVPSGGFEVTNAGADTSYAAIGYTAYGATISKVVLTLAPNANDLPNSTVEACPLTSSAPFTPAQAGPASSGPAYSCTKSVPGVESTNGQTISFAIGSFVSNNYLGIAIVATGASRLVFSPPGDSTILTTAAPTAPAAPPPAASTSSEATVPPVASPMPAPTPISATPVPVQAQPFTSQAPVASPALATPPTAPATKQAPVAAPASVPPQMIAVSAPVSTVGIGSAFVGAILVALAVLAVIRRNGREALARAGMGKAVSQT